MMEGWLLTDWTLYNQSLQTRPVALLSVSKAPAHYAFAMLDHTFGCH